VSGLAEAADLDDVANDVAAIKVTTDKLDDTLEDNSGTFRFTAAALAEAPTGGSAPSASDIYTYFTSEDREDAFKADTSGLSTLAAIDVENAVWNAATGDHTSDGTYGRELNDAALAAIEILADTAEIGAAGAGLTAIPWNSAWDAEVQSEVTDALDAFGWATTEVILTSAYDAAKTAASQISVDDVPTNAELAAAFTEIKGATWNASTDTLEAIRDRGDAAWATADVSGLSTFDPATQQVTVATNNDKTGYKLASDGLDSISITEPTGMATTFREMVIASWMIGYGKQIKDGDAGTIEVYAADGTTVVTTQTYTVVGEVETVNRGT
jgi:hypothetical protein